MHELSLAGALVNTALRHADGRRVAVISVKVGRLRQVVPETLAFAFGFVSRDTFCEGARLELQVIDGRLRCRPCEHEWEIEIPAFRCPICGGAEVEIAAGNEFLIESIEVMLEALST
jgi:hydrogenase nickel incorporation protein HypA/HybF